MSGHKNFFPSDKDTSGHSEPMIEYHKIQSVFLRDPATKFRTFLPQFSIPEFEYLKNNVWRWDEKIDGTNIRVVYDGTSVHFGGRTNEAQIPVFLLERLQDLFPVDKFRTNFPDLTEGASVYLFGEGFGAKIQKGGGNYKPHGCDFILFDVAYNGTFLERSSVEDVASKLAVNAVPIVGGGTLGEAVEFVKAGFKSFVAVDTEFMAEGVVLRPKTELRTRGGERIISKLKRKDFQ